MKITRTTIGVIAVAVAAFALGRSNLLSSSTVVLAAEPQEKPGLLGEIKDAAESTAQAIGDAVQGREDDVAPEIAMMQAYQRMATRGEHHEHLDSTVGSFDATVRFRMTPDGDWMESTGTVTREWVLDKRFLRETVEAQTEMGPFNAISYIGYNNFDGVYELIWLESMSTAMMSSTGTLDVNANTMTIYSKHRDPATGQLRIARGQWNFSNADRESFESYIVDEGGREFKNFEGEYTRKK